MKNKYLLLSAFLLVTGFMQLAAQAVKLEFDPPQGLEYTTQYDIQSTIDQAVMGIEQTVDVKTYMVLNTRVLENTEEYCLVEMRYTRMAVETSTAMFSFVIDSDGDPDENPVNASLKAIIDQPFTARINHRGQLLSIEGVERIIENMLVQSQVDQAASEQYNNILKQSFGEENLNQNLQQFSPAFPTKAVKPGESWTYDLSATSAQVEFLLHNTATLMETTVGGNKIMIKSDMTIPSNSPIMVQGMTANFEMKGTQVGEIIVEPNIGITKSGILTQEIEGEIKLSTGNDEGSDMSIPMKIKNSIHMKTIMIKNN